MSQERPRIMSALAPTFYRSQRALSFNGTNDFMFVWLAFWNTFPQTGDDPFSISLWVYSTKAGAVVRQTIINRWAPHPSGLSANDSGWGIWIQDAGAPLRQLHFFIGLNVFNALWIHSNAAFPLNQWTLVTWTYDGSRTAAGLKMYWNDVLQATTILWGTFVGDASGSNQFSHLFWGTQYIGAPALLTNWFQGRIDETAIWDVELTAGQVAALYHGGYPAHPMHVDDVSTWWRMGEPIDGTPFGIWFISYARYQVGGVDRPGLWNRTPARVIETVPP